MGPEHVPTMRFSEEVRWNEFKHSKVFWGVIPYNPTLVNYYMETWKKGEYPEIMVPHRYSSHYSYKARVIGLTFDDDKAEKPTMKLLLLPTKVIQHIKIKRSTSSPAAPRENPEQP